jgi:heavy metal sensor kinase
VRSIRLSLLVYFLGLLTVALGVASLLFYRSGQRTLQAKEEAAGKLIQAKYQERCREEKARLDDALMAQALALAGRVQIHADSTTFLAFRAQSQVLEVLQAQASPNAHLVAPFWLAQGGAGRGPYASLYRSAAAHVVLPDPVVELPAQAGAYYQVDGVRQGGRLRSESLGELAFPDERAFAKDKPLHWEIDDIELAPGRPVRRIRLKAAAVRSVFSISPPPPPPVRYPYPRPAEPRPSGPRPSGPRRVERLPPAVVVQCASDTHARDAALEGLRASRSEELDRLQQQTAATLVGQRNRLLLISSVTFAATVLGSFWLVWLGLLPLRRLSEAVSRVSPKDFRLPVDEQRLPAELRPIARRLTGALDLLKRAFAREKQATADISHELRTPLAALLTTTELALRKPRSAEHYRELLQDCRLSAQQMNQIVERLLTLARLDAGVDLLRPQPVDVGALAEQCAAVVRPLAEARGLQLAVHAPTAGKAAGQADGGARLMTDPDKLREVLTNLLHNAIQYNRPHGTVDVTVARENGHLEVEVRDTGIGIGPEARELIFERFYRADPSRGTDDLHAGLGLAIVKEYVDLMGGTIAVESEPGRGSTFRVQLPAH